MQLVFECADHTDIVDSDQSFRIGTGAVKASGPYAGKDYDARAEPTGWSGPAGATIVGLGQVLART